MQTLSRFPVRILSAFIGLFCVCASFGAVDVELASTPGGGIQPQVVTGPDGTVHLLYFGGDPKAGDLHYARQAPGETKFSDAVRVNQQRGTSIAVGTIRGGQLALGRRGRVHVIWNGANKAANHHGAPLYYTRSNEAGTDFEPERDLITHAAGLDGGSSIAADAAGNVYAVWHAPGTPGAEGESNRAVFVARSENDGRTFEAEVRVNPPATGVCGCCGLKAFANRRGEIAILYRGASEQVNRDEILLVSQDRGRSFSISGRHAWKIAACPMSSAFLSDLGSVTMAAWETDGQVHYAALDSGTLRLGMPGAPSGSGKRKHPVMARNSRGETLLAWTEGTGWKRGGDVAWQVMDEEGRELKRGRSGGVPPWGLAAAYARGDGTFVILH